MTISTTQQSVSVTEVGMLSVTDIVQDIENNVFVREIRAYGNADPITGSRTLLFSLRVSASTATFIELNAPVQTF